MSWARFSSLLVSLGLALPSPPPDAPEAGAGPTVEECLELHTRLSDEAASASRASGLRAFELCPSYLFSLLVAAHLQDLHSSCAERARRDAGALAVCAGLTAVGRREEELLLEAARRAVGEGGAKAKGKAGCKASSSSSTASSSS
jgi:hypothetical protein